MKKIIAILLTAFMILGLAACANGTENESSVTQATDKTSTSAQETTPTTSEKHVLVVYFR